MNNNSMKKILKYLRFSLWLKFELEQMPEHLNFFAWQLSINIKLKVNKNKGEPKTDKPGKQVGEVSNASSMTLWSKQSQRSGGVLILIQRRLTMK